MRDLTTAQMNKLIAMVLDGQGHFGAGCPIRDHKRSHDHLVSRGLTTEEVRRILTSVNQRQR
jgi:hypothetical protein